MSEKHIPWFNPLYEVDGILQSDSSQLEAWGASFHMLGQEKVAEGLWRISDDLQQSRQIIKDVIGDKLSQDSKQASEELAQVMELALKTLLPKEKKK
jgi:hypothetical protein